MTVSTEIVELLSQLSAVVPIMAPFGAILGALKIILERAQTLSASKQKLASLAVRSARLSLTLHDQIRQHADHLDDRVKQQLNTVHRIIDSIQSQFNKLDKKATWRQFSSSNRITDSVSDLYDQLKSSIDDCQLVLGVDSSAKLTRSNSTLDQTYDRVCNIETHVMKLNVPAPHIDSETELEVVTRSEVLLQDMVATRQAFVSDEAAATIITFNALLRGHTPVYVKIFEALDDTIAKKAFEAELMKSRKIWRPFLSQPFGHSDRNGFYNCILYNSPITSSRVPFMNLLDQYIARDPVMTLPLLFSLQDLIRQWGATLTVFPFTEYDYDRELVSKCAAWLNNLTIDSQTLEYPSRVTPVFDGDLCVMKNNGTSHAADVLMTFVGNQIKRDRNLDSLAIIYDALTVRWGDPMTLSGRLPISFDALTDALRKSGWVPLDSRPWLLVQDTEVHLSTKWRWFRGQHQIDFRHWFWDDQLGCNRQEAVYWWNERGEGEHSFNCTCEEQRHGDICRRFDRLRINWPGTPLHGFEVRSRDYIEGNGYDWRVLIPPSSDPSMHQGEAHISTVSPNLKISLDSNGSGLAIKK